MGSSDLKTHIVILNYRGADLLPQCLPSIVEAACKAHSPTRVTVLNNPGPESESGLDYVRREYPEVLIKHAPRNRILCSYNDYLSEIHEPIAILLNNDIRVDENFIDPLVEKFVEDAATFLVAPKVMTFDGKSVEAGRSKAGICWGMFWCNARYPGYEKEVDASSETYSSGFGAFSRDKFLKLGGYDDRYLPGIMEDVDLCYRAQRAGYHLYYEPKSVVHHMGQASFKKEFGSKQTLVMAHRNNFLFMWKNFSSPLFWLEHLFFLPMRLLYALIAGKCEFVTGFIQAIGCLWKSRVSPSR